MANGANPKTLAPKWQSDNSPVHFFSASKVADFNFMLQVQHQIEIASNPLKLERRRKRPRDRLPTR
jgi:hypothetical protein